MIVSGDPIGADEALANGLIDLIVDGDLTAGGGAFAEKVLDEKRPLKKIRDLSDKIAPARGKPEIFAEFRKSVARQTRGFRAPENCIKAVEAAVNLPFDEGMKRERELFVELLNSPESKAQRYFFFAEREAAKIPDVPADTPAKDVKKAAVIGAGTMGGGIAMAYANTGIPVLLKDVDQAALDRGMSVIRRNYQSTMAKGKMTPEAMTRTLARITPTTSYDGFDNVDIVVEAVFEHMDLKKTTFAELATVTRPDAILASNTSTLDIDELAGASGRPAQVVGHHFFSPANVMTLLEIVRGRGTSREVIATSLKLAKQLGKTGVVVGNCFGFVANRMLAYYMREAYLLLEEGASVVQIDNALTDFGYPVGPFGMQDIAGIDVGWRIRQHLKSVGKTRAEGPQSTVPDRLYEMGRYGQKTGAGWYRYESGSRTRIPDPLVDEVAAEEAAKRGVTRRSIPDEDIIARIMTALANEGARVLEERFAIRASDIDVVYVNGFGYPRHRGGPMFYADTVGLPTVLARVNEYRRQFGDHWRPSPLLEKLASEGGSFYGDAA
jgi:3-hydroxyacyl-CoA dehydrogenase